MVALLRETAAGWHATRLLLVLRWRMMRKPGSRATVWAGITLFVLAMALVANMGFIAQIAAQQPDTAQGIFARAWVASLDSGYMLNIGEFAIGGAVLAALFAPFTGTSTLTLAPTEDLYGLRPPRLHRYFGAWLINAASGLGLLQLLVLTGVASLITMDGYRIPGLVFVLTLWLLLITVMTSLGWLLEVVVRKTRPRMRMLLGLLTAAALVYLYMSDQRRSGRLFGLSDVFTHAVRDGVSGWTTKSILLPTVTAFIIVLVLLAGLMFTRQALSLPMPPAVQGKTLILRPLSMRPGVAVRQLLVRTLIRTREVRRPMLGLVLIGAGLVAAVPMDMNLELSIIAAVSIAVSLSWAVNVYGLLGTGMIWLAAQPQTLRRLPFTVARVQLMMTMGLLCFFWLISFLSGHATPASGLSILIGGVIAAAVSTSLSAFLAVRRPQRARMSGRGDSLLPPLTALSYMFALMLAGPLPAAWILSTPDQGQAALIAAGALAVAALMFTVAWWTWRSPNHQARLTAQVSPA